MGVLMKLDLDCIRDILLKCEAECSLNESLEWTDLTLSDFENLGYSNQEIAYTIVLLEEADYIVASINYFDNAIGYVSVSRLTYFGHEFLDSIRPESIWEKIKHRIASIGNVSLPVIQSLGSEFISQYLFHNQS